ncbi:SDR family NAD(P)-dependent oxidoreductase [Microbacterium azadirachtae]|uniref:Acetoacetyl-CoA reductase n=1 Tax=Microbacterium azadirachtae TaxID=582680 RepID=A0A0F0KGB6_9MICO|nr:SDR family oxidoreductase [Microbacterium azadirachtae]KJL19942.1 Acetoacetyl-CoA reductase [Microbacterium azadirachtae]SDL87804.1 3-oxoacyl-[acyl-carrier protein] reductase [Microbacterium azadirachtae]SEG19545.1 3-oxoacyl-[acyl-carrier protein] reductase [Microbacterium azadirachtae]SEG21850.1 3-oxoacyl-[acyl-carrier protein] reductase [Microbacterium azadirachtae]
MSTPATSSASSRPLSSSRPLAVISGGGTGIGLASARRLARDGFDLALIGRRPEVLDAASARILEGTPEAHVQTITADLQDPAQVEAAAAAIGGSVDVLLNNAGGNVLDRGEGLAGIAANYEANMRLNVLTAVLLTEALLPRITRPGGRIISISSIAALRGANGYGAAKAAIHGWMMGLAADLAPEGVTVNAVAPGYVPDTGFWDGRRTPDIVASRLAQVPMNRAGTPDEVAGAVSYLAGPEGGWTTGQILQINGGALFGRG